MCIKNNFNKVLEYGTKEEINDFMNKCDNTCEQCIKFGSCDYYSQLDDKLKELDGELLRCPYCGDTGELCDFPDLFWEDCDNTKEINKQYELLEQMWDKGFNIVTCQDCGQVFIHKIIKMRK